MHYQPHCPNKKHIGRKICISAKCQVQNPFICEECPFAHEESCQIITYKEIVKKLHIMQGLNHRELLRYQDYVENTFNILIKSLRAQFIAFRQLFQHINASDSIKSFYQFIKSRKQYNLTGQSVHKMLSEKFVLRNNYKLKSQAAMWSLSGQIIQFQKRINKKLPYYYSVSPDALEVNLELEETHPMKKIQKDFRIYRDQITGGLLQNCINKLEPHFGKEIYNVQLLYRASQSEFSAKAFHQKCDGRKNTLVIAKTQFGNIVGGFCALPWRSPPTWQYDEDVSKRTFLFSLHRHLQGRKFQPQKNRFALGMHREYGPCFGDDLVIYDKSNTSKGCWSNFPDCYQCTSQPVPHNEQTIRQFVGVNDHFRKFCMLEWEVYLISFSRKQQMEGLYMEEYRKI